MVDKNRDAYIERWRKAAEEKGHQLDLIKADEEGVSDSEVGEINWWADCSDIHNGPRCVLCGHSWCVWCTRPEEIKVCVSVTNAGGSL